MKRSDGARTADGPHAAAASSRRRLIDAAVGLVVAALAVLAWGWLVRTVIVAEPVQIVAAYLVVWVPLAIAVVVAVHAHGTRSFALDLGLRFRWIDLLWGIGVGCLVRGVAALIEFAVWGRISGSGVAFGFDPTWAWFTLLVAPVLVGPFVEEVFFRGLVQRAVTDRTRAGGAGPRTAAAIGIVTTALVFALLHVLDAPSPGTALVLGLSALTIGLGCGILAALTGRLGGAIIAHAVSNGLLVLLIVA
ncbi:CPBP family intramembrane metalloprotease [Agromyces intestinalis]|uniref:CPBP family intramembrane metalloprotease n=1 Tax=Agromyces intestinalis TaxID=2592652 RepID=A0A5C1YDG4_9MICO|nr:CPBP family intramembrane glutamic endopeptidase [Agromyces intestinalis]QEO13678.1 CPBP family intramembrane metalloprotease [Agromyces intestinalis]